MKKPAFHARAVCGSMEGRRGGALSHWRPEARDKGTFPKKPELAQSRELQNFLLR